MARESLADLDDQTLLQRLVDARQELFNLRFQHATGQLTNHNAIKAAKKRIARCLTEARTREIAAAESLEAEIATGLQGFACRLALCSVLGSPLDDDGAECWAVTSDRPRETSREFDEAPARLVALRVAPKEGNPRPAGGVSRSVDPDEVRGVQPDDVRRVHVDRHVIAGERLLSRLDEVRSLLDLDVR